MMIADSDTGVNSNEIKIIDYRSVLENPKFHNAVA